MRTRIVLLAAVILAAVTFSVPAGERTVTITGAEVTLPEIGDVAEDFNLFGVDLRYHSLDMYRESRAIVLIFTCNHCPVSIAYEDYLVKLAKEYQPKNIQFIAFNTNPVDKVARDGFPQMVERAEEKKFPFPYLYDETQTVSHAYGARRTPHIYVLGPAGDRGRRQFIYIGAVDARHEEPFYLKNALDAFLAGEEISPRETEARGCTVKYRTAEERIARFGYDVFAR